MNILVVLDSFWIPQILNLLYKILIVSRILYLQFIIIFKIVLKIRFFWISILIYHQDFLKLLHILIIRMAVFL